MSAKNVFMSLALVGALAGTGVLPFLTNTAHAQAAPPIKIAVVDLNEAMNNVDEGKLAIASLEKRFAERKVDLDKRQRDLQALQDDLEKKALVMSEEARKTKAKELQDKFGEYQNVRMEAESEMANLRSQMQDTISEKLKAVCADIAKKEGYTLIVEKNVVWYSIPQYDITSQLIKIYNSKPKK